MFPFLYQTRLITVTDSKHDSNHCEKWNEWITNPWAGLPDFQHFYQDLHEDIVVQSDDEGSTDSVGCSVSPSDTSTALHLSDFGSDSDVPVTLDHEDPKEFEQPIMGKIKH